MDITPATLTVTGTSAAGKVYDGTTTAALSGATLTGVIGGDVVTLGSDSTGTFATANAGSGIAVTTSMTIGGADAGNYHAHPADRPHGQYHPLRAQPHRHPGIRRHDQCCREPVWHGRRSHRVGSQTLTLSGTGTLSSKDVNTRRASRLSGA